LRSWAARSGLPPKWSPPAALRAIRATLVMGGLFALTDQVLGNLQMATFAAFGSFATLVLSSFSGTRRDKLVAHALLALVGCALVAIGTLVSAHVALAAVVTVPVTFAVFFAGVAGPNAASGATGALLAYVLPAASAGTAAMIPDRVAGWLLASLAGTAAVLALSPRRGDDALRAAAARTAGALAHTIGAALEGPAAGRLESLIAVERELRGLFASAPYRPLGLAAPDQALANAVELLEWCTSLVADALHERDDLSAVARLDRALLAATAATLAATAELLAGAAGELPLAELERCRTASLGAVARLTPGDSDFERDARVSFHAQAIAVATLALGADALVAERRVAPRAMDARRRAYVGLAGAEGARRLASVAVEATRHASLRSVWFVNSARVSLSLGAAVAIADLSSVQHGFWVVLGALSVLRTNAASTRSTALQALSGTVIGFVVGGALLLAIGSSEAALWLALPVAVLVAAYSPGTAPFALGQAAFTVTVAVLFNLIAPVGWKVGIVRVEDVAIGCAVSVAFGAMFWPRGVAAVVGDDLADAYRAGASFLAQAVQWTAGLSAVAPDGEQAALTAGLRLDEALRGFLTERGSKRVDKPELWRLVGGTLRLRLTAHAVAGLPREQLAAPAARAALAHRTGTLTGWYERLAELLDRPRGRQAPALEPPSFGAEDAVLAAYGSHYGVWLCEHLDHLSEHLAELVRPALRIAELRRAPWWR